MDKLTFTQRAWPLSDDSGERVYDVPGGVPPLHILQSPIASAVFSLDEKHRLLLKRGNGRRSVCWIMLNPSKADEVTDDPTIRRCASYTRLMECSGLFVVNLFSLIATEPKGLANPGRENPKHVSNDDWLFAAADQSLQVIAAWGAFSGGDQLTRELIQARKEYITKALQDRGHSVKTLHVTKDGHPGHPLYLPRTAGIQEFKGY